jgi:hypothetical protein
MAPARTNGVDERHPAFGWSTALILEVRRKTISEHAFLGFATQVLKIQHFMKEYLGQAFGMAVGILSGEKDGGIAQAAAQEAPNIAGAARYRRSYIFA